VEQELVEHKTQRLQSLGAGVHGVEVTTLLLRGRPATAHSRSPCRRPWPSRALARSRPC
jgi:hypothetical protein